MIKIIKDFYLLIIVVLIWGIFIIGMCFYPYYSCNSRWEEFRKPKFSIFSKCTILDNNGERIPEDRFRSVD